MAEYSNYMWSVPDWRTDEMYTMLDNREQGIIRNLFDECWVSGSMTSDPEALARFSREPLEYFLTVWAKIRHKFHPVQGGKRLISLRQEEDRRRLMLRTDFYEKRAKKAAKIRWAKERADNELHATSNASSINKPMLEHAHSQSHRERDPSLIHSTNTETSVVPDRVRTARKTGAPAELAVTDQMRAWAKENGITVDLDAETAAMLDHHRGRGNLHGDWVATWRTWMRNSKKFNRNGNGNGQPKEHYQDRIVRENKETAERLHRLFGDTTGDGAGPEDPSGTDVTLRRGPK